MPVPILHTERLYLRPLHVGDAHLFWELNLHPDILRFTGDPPFPDIPAAADFLSQYDPYTPYARGRMAIILKSTGESIGWCGLKYHPDTDETDIGYRLLPRHWGLGYATEAARAAVTDGFTRLQLPHIIAQVHPQNTRSLRIISKLHMSYLRTYQWGPSDWDVYIKKRENH